MPGLRPQVEGPALRRMCREGTKALRSARSVFAIARRDPGKNVPAIRVDTLPAGSRDAETTDAPRHPCRGSGQGSPFRAARMRANCRALASYLAPAIFRTSRERYRPVA